MHLGRHELGLEEAGVGREWLLTNGLGGFASSTPGGLNTRRYHGWLVPHVRRYGGRFVVLSKLEEELRLDGETHRLTTNRYVGGPGAAGGVGGGPGPVITPRGYRFLQGFSLAPLPVFHYYLRGFFIDRVLYMPRGENRIVAIYSFTGPRGATLSLRLRPLMTFRFYHHLLRANDWPFSTAAGEGWVTVQPHHDSPYLVLRNAPGTWSPGGAWHMGVEYLEERHRGLDHVEDLYSPGFFEFSGLGADDRAAVSAVLAEDDEEAERLREEPFDLEQAGALQIREEERLLGVVQRARHAVEERSRTAGRRPVNLVGAVLPSAEKRDARPPEIGDAGTPEASAFFSRLVRATDAFVAVRGSASLSGDSREGAAGPVAPPRGAGAGSPRAARDAGRRTTVIAGYPWFEDWGRDTFIAFPGLLLVTGRHEEAFQVLCDYASFARDGLIPNRFPDQTEEPDYNTVDASLWFFAAAQAYLAYTGDRAAVVDKLLDPMREMAAHYLRGTRYGIGTGPDGLLHAGQPGFAVTWMDAKLGDWVVTPREGYPVEINALWYNALRFLAEFCEESGAGGAVPEAMGGNWRGLAARVKDAFNARFWNDEAGCLYDVVQDPGSGRPPDPAVRPNQLLAISLPFAALDRARWRAVVEVCLKELYVTYGLCTLSRSHPAYRGFYRGGQAERDGAYHQGTAWPWLIGPFITALRRAHGRSEASRLVAARMLRPFERHLREAGIGFISEVVDGDFPYQPGGCIAQAWSVGEILRAYVEDVLDIGPWSGTDEHEKGRQGPDKPGAVAGAAGAQEGIEKGEDT